MEAGYYRAITVRRVEANDSMPRAPMSSPVTVLSITMA